MVDSYLLCQWTGAHVEQNGDITTDEQLADGLVSLCVATEAIIWNRQDINRSKIGSSQSSLPPAVFIFVPG
jgi:hypothetical protein